MCRESRSTVHQLRRAAQASRWLFYVIITFYVQIVLLLFICTYHGLRIPYLQKYSQRPYYSMLDMWIALHSSSFMYKAVIFLLNYFLAIHSQEWNYHGKWDERLNSSRAVLPSSFPKRLCLRMGPLTVCLSSVSHSHGSMRCFHFLTCAKFGGVEWRVATPLCVP